MIRVQNLSRSFGSVQAVDDLTFGVTAGEIFALVGPNGAGKTTTIKMILGLLRPDHGTVVFNGAPISPDDNRYKARMGYVPENCALYENLTGFEFLEFVGHLHHLPPDEVRRKGERLFYLLDMGDTASQLIREYSKGTKQKVLIISALLHDPDLIILDEPFSGLDANAVSVFREAFRAEAHKGKAVIFCSHILDVVERLVDRVLIIKEGKSLAAGTPDEIMRQTGHASLDRAFNDLTGAHDVAARARDIIDTIDAGDKGADE
jgi:ABC-2 type transport system ATP-binding protein